MYKINYLTQEKNNQLSFVFETRKHHLIGDNIILKINDELYVAEITKSNYTILPSDYDTFKIVDFTYTAKTILEVNFDFLNCSFSIIEFINNENHKKLLNEQHTAANQI